MGKSFCRLRGHTHWLRHYIDVQHGLRFIPYIDTYSTQAVLVRKTLLHSFCHILIYPIAFVVIIANRILPTVDPVALFLAELEPPLASHVRRRGARTSRGFWPWDLGLFLQAFATFVLQRQLYTIRADILPEPELEVILRRFYEECPSEDNLWQAMLHTPWPQASDARHEIRARIQRRQLRRAATTAHSLGVPIGVATTTTSWSVLDSEESLSAYRRPLGVPSPSSSPSTTSNEDTPTRARSLSPIPESRRSNSEADLSDEEIRTLQDIVDLYNEGMGWQLTPEQILDGTPGRVTVPISPMRRETTEDDSRTRSTSPPIPNEDIVDLTSPVTQTDNDEEDWGSQASPTRVTSFRFRIAD